MLQTQDAQNVLVLLLINAFNVIHHIFFIMVFVLTGVLMVCMEALSEGSCNVELVMQNV